MSQWRKKSYGPANLPQGRMSNPSSLLGSMILNSIDRPKASYVPLAKEVVRRPRELETREPKVVVGGIVSVGGMPGFGSVGAVAGTAGRIASGVRTADKITGAVDAASGTPKQVIMIDKPKVQTGGALIDPSKGKKKKRSEMDLDLE